MPKGWTFEKAGTRASGRRLFLSMLVSAVLVAAYLAATSSGSFAATTHSSASTYKIGFLLTSSGQAAFVGQEAMAGAKVAIAQVNAKGGINGHKLVADYEDTQLSPTLAVSELNKMISVSGEKLFVVQATPVVNAVKPLAAQLHVVMINHAGVDPSIADGENYMFTTIATAAQEAPPLTRYMIQVAKVHKMATLTDSSAIGKAATATMSAAFKVYGGSVVDTETFQTGATDFKAQLIKIQQSGADAVFMAPNGALGAANILKEANDLGLKVKFFANTFFEDPTLPGLAGNLANGVVYSHVAFNPTRNALAKSLQAAWLKSGQTGVVPIYTATAYDAVLLLADAVRHVGYDAPKVRDYLLKEKDFVGATGGITFTSRGQARMAVQLKTVSGGKFVVIKTPPVKKKK